ncbi:gamma-glutamyltransferase [Nocardioides sp. IC4_145]|uniref:gamma-glutamyltransferase n=1 Tax=Nocardioides sp. IC4_145 TaxID=2714037 RepID=UPI00140D3352|nr:gamma-glutamyltransferase [Nocardioides sp. IC4_145]NHC24891.1 gamma-glutamyltransferase [Nocardioides sp. IC4_145]
MRRRSIVRAVPVLALLAPTLVALPGAPPAAAAPVPPKIPVATGTGGAVSSVDPDATRIGLAVLRSGGNAADAAVATAAALGVTEPYSAGIGGGGYFVHYDASTGKVATIDGRETAPQGIPADAFLDPATGEPYPFTPDLVTSGVSVGTPGTLATWKRALDRWGSRSLKQVLGRPAALARKGFVVDETFRQQTKDNRERFRTFTSTRRLFLRGGKLPVVGTRFRNPDLARTYDLVRRDGLKPFYRGAIAAEIVRAVRKPPLSGRTDLPVPTGYLTKKDLRGYRVKNQAATRTSYRGLDVHGMAPSSSGGSTVGEALEILERHDLAAMDDAQALHLYLEASARAFADRTAYVGDPAYVDVPLADLLSPTFAAERDCTIDPTRAATKPVEPGDVTSYDGECATGGGAEPVEAPDTENVETTHLSVVDRWGDVVSYTLTIEQTGGSGIVVPGRGFLLNNELTDFSAEPDPEDPNRIQPGKRPRSSMSPTIVLRDGRPVLAVGSPGGSTIITTVLQILVERFDRGRSIAEAVAAPRASQRNTAAVTAEPGFIDAYGALLEAYGHELAPAGDALTSAAEIGAAAAIEIGPGGLLTAAAEPTRRGGGSAGVVRPRN